VFITVLLKRSFRFGKFANLLAPESTPLILERIDLDSWITSRIQIQLIEPVTQFEAIDIFLNSYNYCRMPARRSVRTAPPSAKSRANSASPSKALGKTTPKTIQKQKSTVKGHKKGAKETPIEVPESQGDTHDSDLPGSPPLPPALDSDQFDDPPDITLYVTVKFDGKMVYRGPLSGCRQSRRLPIQKPCAGIGSRAT
jgi:hypothetical protein